jgi:zinc protease
MSLASRPKWALSAVFALLFGPIAPDAHGQAGNGAPQPSTYALLNGLGVRLVPRPGEKKVAVLLFARAGFFAEPAGKPHLAHVAEHVTVFSAPEGSEEALAVQKWFETRKANAETLGHFMYFDIEVDSTELEMAIRVQAQRLARAEFREAVLKREIPNALSEIDFVERSEQGGTSKFALTAFAQNVLHDQKTALIRSVSRQFTVADLQSFHERNFRPDTVMLCVVGDFDPQAAKALIEKALGAIPRPKSPRPAAPKPPQPGVRDIRWDLATSHVVVAWPTPPPTQSEHAALTLAANFASERLFGDQELQAGAKMPFATNEADGFFMVNLQAKNNANLDALAKRVQDLISPLATPGGLSDEQITFALPQYVQLLKGVEIDTVPLPQGMSKVMALANMELQNASKAILWGDTAGYTKRLGALKPPAVRAAIKRYLDPKKALIVRITPGAEAGK